MPNQVRHDGKRQDGGSATLGMSRTQSAPTGMGQVRMTARGMTVDASQIHAGMTGKRLLQDASARMARFGMTVEKHKTMDLRVTPGVLPFALRASHRCSNRLYGLPQFHNQ
jgi:hypothetical protein